MLYIRVDGNEIIATGHVMRCLSIAKELRRQGEDTTFILADNRPKELITQYGFSTISLETVWNDMNQEIEKLVTIIMEKEVSLLLIDSYFVTKEYLEALREHTKIAYIDDINSFIYPVDYLINYNMFAEKLNYKERYTAAGFDTEFFLGCFYAPLRNEFSGVRRVIRKDMKKVLVTTGGTDHYNVTDHFLEKVQAHDLFEQLEFYVIVGKFNQNKDVLMEKWGGCRNIHLLENVSNMAELMTDCDAAITAGGVTTYELCACGIPSVMYTLADNQLEIAETVSEEGLMPWVGDVREDAGGCVDRMLEYLAVYQKDYEQRRLISQRMQGVVDGLGCKRLAERICQEMRLVMIRQKS